MFVGYDIVGIEKPSQGFLIKEAMDRVVIELLSDVEGVITVDVFITDDIGETMGLASEEDDDQFTILLNEVLLDDDVELFRTACHEMVHIAQYVKKDLIHLPRNQYAWKGKVMDGGEYSKRPWEIQAYEIEEKLSCQFENSQQSDI